MVLFLFSAISCVIAGHACCKPATMLYYGTIVSMHPPTCYSAWLAVASFLDQHLPALVAQHAAQATDNSSVAALIRDAVLAMPRELPEALAVRQSIPHHEGTIIIHNESPRSVVSTNFPRCVAAWKVMWSALWFAQGGWRMIVLTWHVQQAVQIMQGARARLRRPLRSCCTSCGHRSCSK